MGAVRGREFDAVIGVGGIGPEAYATGVAEKVNWIGIGPHKVDVGKRGPEVTFDHFLDYGIGGDDFRKLAPILAERMYANNIRSLLLGFTEQELEEALAIVQRAAEAPPSPGREAGESRTRSVRRCVPKRSIRRCT